MAGDCWVGLLGPVAARSGGRTATLRGATGRTVLARLSLAHGRVVTVDQLTDALWDDAPPASATSAIHSAISRLRSQLGASAIISDGDGYRVDTDLVTTDIHEVEALAAAASSSVDPADAAELLRRALALWRGEPLADTASTHWATPERARLSELRASLTDRYHQARLDAGDTNDVIVDLEREARVAPLREPTQLLLMRALGESGRAAEALRVGAGYRERLVEETGLDPSPAFAALEFALLDGAVTATAPVAPVGAGPTDDRRHRRATPHGRPRRHWAPPDNELVGRDEVLAATRQALGRRRLVTILGPGGMGKTRLAMELVATEPDAEVVVVELASVPPGGEVTAALAGELGLSATGPNVVADLAERLDLFGALLVLDNCEHVLEAARDLAADLLRRAPSTRVVVTSRRRLGLPDEHIVRLDPLPVDVAPHRDGPTVRMFLDRVRRVSPTVAPHDDADHPAIDPAIDAAIDPAIDDAAIDDIAAICRAVDGIPLAIELAASRAGLLGLAGLRERLDRSHDVLSLDGGRDRPSRQSTLDATISSSLELLTPTVIAAFEELSIFPSWFAVDDADAVMAAAGSSADALTGIAELVDSSLLAIDRSGERPRYRMLEPVRQHARRRLELAGRDGIVADAHATWALAAGDRMEGWWSGDDSVRSMRELRGRRADLVAALAHLGASGRTDDVDRLARQIGMVLIEHPDVGFSTLIPTITSDSIDGAAARAIIGSSVGRPRPEELDDLRRALEVITDDDPRRHFLRFAFVPAQQYQGDIDGAVATCRLMMADPETPPRLRVLAVSMWALAEAFMGRFDEAERVLADHAEVLALTDVGGFVEYVRAEVAGGTDADQALRHVDRAIWLSQDAPDSFVAASAKALHLSLLVHSGRTAEAADLALDLAPELLAAGTVPHAWRALRASAHVLNARGDHTTAAQVLAAAEHDPRAPVVLGNWTATIERQWAMIDEALGAERVEEIRRESTSLTIAELWSEVEVALTRSKP